MKYSIEKILQENCSAHDLSKWFKPLNLCFDENNTNLTVYFPHPYFEPWFTKQGKTTFEQTVKNVGLQKFGHIPTIKYAVSNSFKKNTPAIYDSFLENNYVNLSDKSFSNFFYNVKNEFTITAAQEIAKENRSQAYNPFIIYGKSSTGKTHILSAIHLELLKNSKTKIFNGTARELYILINEQGVKSFINKYSIFIIDNFQYIDTATEFQQKLIRFFDICINKKKQLIFASNSLPTVQKKYIEELRSRLSMGLTVVLASPDIDVRMRYILAHCHEQDIKITKNQLLTIAQRCTNMSVLHGIILKISAFMSFYQKSLDDFDVENILFSLGDEKKSITSQDIIRHTSKYLNVDSKKIFGNARQSSIVLARQIAMHLCRDLLGLSYPNIGKVFGGKDHSTVMYSIKKIELLINMNKDTQLLVEKIKQKCLSN